MSQPKSPATSFAITEAMADLIIGKGTTRESAYMAEILRCVRESRPGFRHEDYCLGLVMTHWERCVSGGLVFQFPDGVKTVACRPLTVRYNPRVHGEDLAVVFYDPEDFNREGVTIGWVLPLGGVLSPETLMEIEDVIGELIGRSVSVPLLAAPVWVSEPWGKATINLEYLAHQTFHNSVPVILSASSTAPPQGRAYYTVMCETDEGIVVSYLGKRKAKVVVRKAEARTDERLPEGFDPLAALGLSLGEATDDDIRTATVKLTEAGPKANDTVVVELKRLGRELNLEEELDLALWRKAVGLARKWAFNALRQKSPAASRVTAEDSTETPLAPAKPKRQRQPRGAGGGKKKPPVPPAAPAGAFNPISGLPSLADAAAVALPGDDPAEGSEATGSDPAAEPVTQG